MTDSTPSPLPDLPPEELASAYVDGELSVEARRIVEADPRLMAMVSAHGAVHDAVGSPVPELADTERERLVAALTAMSSPTPATAATAATSVTPQDGGQVVDLAAARPARSRRLVQVAAGGLAAVAAVGVLALVISRNDSGGTSQTSDQLTQAADSAATPAEVTAAASGSGSSLGGSSEDQSGRTAASATAAASPPPDAPASELPQPAGVAPEAAITGLEDLGPLANRAAFIAAARRFATVPPPTGPSACPTYPSPLATATFQGTPAYLVVLEVSAAGNRVALVDTATCAVLVKADLAEQ